MDFFNPVTNDLTYFVHDTRAALLAATSRSFQRSTHDRVTPVARWLNRLVIAGGKTVERRRKERRRERE